MRKFFKTTLQITILSEDEPAKWNSLTELDYENNFGHYSAKESLPESEEVSATEIAKLLLDQGTTPEFFGLNDDGTEIESSSDDGFADGGAPYTDEELE